MTFVELAKKIITEEGKPLSTDEMWQLAKAKGYDRQVSTKGKTPDYTLAAIVYSDAKSGNHSTFVAFGARPKRFFVSELLTDALIKTFEKQPTQPHTVATKVSYDEKDLHPFLVRFAKLHLQAYTKTILHHTSVKKEFGEWVHPDIVGCHFPLEDWKSEIVDLGVLTGNTGIKLFSFELKKALDFANLRAAFFQAVSNSSWANEGYLVAAELSTDEEFQVELKRLSGSFGIGVIKLHLEDPDSSEVIFPSATKDYLDWDSMNKLAMNANYREFLKRIKADLQTKEVRVEYYDHVYEPDQLMKLIKTK